MEITLSEAPVLHYISAIMVFLLIMYLIRGITIMLNGHNVNEKYWLINIGAGFDGDQPKKRTNIFYGYALAILFFGLAICKT